LFRAPGRACGHPRTRLAGRYRAAHGFVTLNPGIRCEVLIAGDDKNPASINAYWPDSFTSG